MTFLRALWAFVLRLFAKPALEEPSASAPAPGDATAPEAPAPEPPPTPTPVTQPEILAPEEKTVIAKPDLTAHIPDEFFLNGVKMAGRLGSARFDEYLAVWENESGVSANPNPSSVNPPAVGLIQWTTHPWSPPDGHSTPDEFRTRYDLVDQLVYAEHYYAPHAPYESRGDIYGVTYVPARVAQRGRAPEVVLVTKDADPSLYNPNASLDVNRDNAISIQDLIDVATAATKRDSARWAELVARTRWAEEVLGVGPKIAVGAATVAVLAVVAIASYLYVKA